MGVRSNVGIAIAPEVQLPEEILSLLKGWEAECKVAPNGDRLFVLYDIKWYMDGDTFKVRECLEGLPEDRVRVVVTTPEYPGDEGSDLGTYDDAWSLGRIVYEELNIDDLDV